MSGYVKRIALIKGIKSGFSANGGELSGLVKAELYANRFKVEMSLINFAPITEGKFVYAITDGINFLCFEQQTFECQSDFNISNGFAAIICFCKSGISPIASAVCGDMGWMLPALKNYLEKLERVPQDSRLQNSPQDSKINYCDDAIAEENYFEHNADESGEPLRKDKKEEKKRTTDAKDEKNFTPFSGGKEEKLTGDTDVELNNFNNEQILGGLAMGYYEGVQADIKNIFDTYPKDDELEKSIKFSHWVRIYYGKDKYYCFGIIEDSAIRDSIAGNGGNNSDGERVKYICYALPANNGKTPPKSLADRVTYVETESCGYWVMYQDAYTGASIKIEKG